MTIKQFFYSESMRMFDQSKITRYVCDVGRPFVDVSATPIPLIQKYQELKMEHWEIVPYGNSYQMLIKLRKTIVEDKPNVQ